MRNKKNDPILGNRIWLIPILLCLLLLSCLNDVFEPNGLNHGGNKELTVEIARSWYDRHYTPVFGMHTRSASGKTRSSERLLKPDWEKSQENHRGRYEVVETPLKMQGSSIITDEETSERWNQNQPPKFIRNVSRMVVLKDKKTGAIRSFIMIFVGSYNYLQKSRTMGKNSYLRREKDFDGSVLFYEMDGTFINGWSYSEGRIVATLSPAADDEQPRHSSEPPRTRGFDNCSPSCFTTYTTQCTEESAYATFDEEYGAALTVIGGNCFPVDVTECVTRCGYVPDYGGGSSGEDSDENYNQNQPAGGAGGGSTSTPTPSEKPSNPNPQLDPYKQYLGSMIDRIEIKEGAIGAGRLAESKFTLKDIFDPTARFSITIATGLTDIQHKLVLFHEMQHMRLLDISQRAGSAQELAKRDSTLLQDLNNASVNDAHHNYLGK